MDGWIRKYEAAIAKPYAACRRLGFAIRFGLLLDYWVPHFPHLWLVELQREAEWEREAALSVMAGEPLPRKPGNLSASPVSVPVSSGLGPPASVPAGSSPRSRDCPFMYLELPALSPGFCSAVLPWPLPRCPTTQLQKGGPDFPLPSNFFQLLQRNPKAFPGQLRDIVPPACPGSSPGPPPIWASSNIMCMIMLFLGCHLIMVEGFECPNDPRSYASWGFMPLVESPKADRS
ncbi:hypothetical protein CCH79_00018753 [Gambusia affinis]|uniref:Uncharacterized protein n=1 Tax=Gambusia affinis TaxID=33528 RepID=A0A315UXA6_GAMAF|nr:hypothetical protein CCH79_00018753 [Gambusia affinis]